MTYRVLSTDNVSHEGLAPLIEDGSFEVESIDDSSTPEFDEALRTANALVVRSATDVDASLLDKAPELAVIGRAGVGVDSIDVDEATKRGIPVFNAPGGNTNAAAELTIGLMLAVMRNIPEADASIRRGAWDRKRLGGVELSGKSLGVIGLGRIGTEVARLANAFGMDVIAHHHGLTEEDAETHEVSLMDLDGLLTSSDVVTLHVPLTDETTHIIDDRALGLMKERAFLVNVSRGGVVDEEALARALVEGSIAGAALDVYEAEPLDDASPLLDAPNLVMTPHLGASTEESQVRVAGEIADKVKAALVDGDFSEALNADAFG